jgi:hypothetical protein
VGAGSVSGVGNIPLGAFDCCLSRAWNTCIDIVLQNPDEPAKKPTLQSYTIDLNQTGPMVRSYVPSRLVIADELNYGCFRFSMH